MNIVFRKMKPEDNKKLKENDFESAISIIEEITGILISVQEKLTTDPELEKLRDDFNKLAKANRLLNSSISNHRKASSNINRLLFEHTGGRTKQRLLQDSEKRIKRGLILTKTAGSVITRGVLGG